MKRLLQMHPLKYQKVCRRQKAGMTVWRRQAAEREAEREAETERREYEAAERARQRQAAADRVEAGVAHDLTFALAREVADVLDAERKRVAGLVERVSKLESGLADLKAKASVIDLPARRVS
jgi:hypothetical protein